jgi:hypothetical protein
LGSFRNQDCLRVCCYLGANALLTSAVATPSLSCFAAPQLQTGTLPLSSTRIRHVIAEKCGGMTRSGSCLARRASSPLSPKTNAYSSTVFVDEIYSSHFDRQLQFFSGFV